MDSLWTLEVSGPKKCLLTKKVVVMILPPRKSLSNKHEKPSTEVGGFLLFYLSFSHQKKLVFRKDNVIMSILNGNAKSEMITMKIMIFGWDEALNVQEDLPPPLT